MLPPPGRPAQVLDYLAATHRVALSNDRLLGCDAGQVRLRVRDNGTGGKRTVSLPTDTFIGRFPCATCCQPASSACATTGCSPAATSGPGLPAARAALQTPAPQATVIEAAEHFLARVSGRTRDAARTVESGVGTRSRSSWLAGTIRPHWRRAVGMGRHEHSRAPSQSFADAASAPAGRGTFPTGERDRHRTPDARPALDCGRLRRSSRTLSRDRPPADDPIQSRPIRCG